MTDQTFHYLKNRVYLAHNWLIQAGESVSEDQFSHIFSMEAPPLGWHLWHMTRFVDRLQAKLTEVTTEEHGLEIWYQKNLALSWGLEADKLGVYETGMGQAHEDAHQTIIKAGQAAIVDYARTVFEAGNATIAKLSDSQMEKIYFGILDYGYDSNTGQVWSSDPKESVIAEDLIFHVTHASRHAGMMEALRGLMGRAGTLSV